LELSIGVPAAAREHLLAAHRLLGDDLDRYHESLGMTWLLDGHPHEALAEFRLQQHAPRERAMADLRIAQALQALGRHDEAIAAYRKALDSEPSHAEAQDSLARIAGAR
jgi:tetratricopeptide (TPR) repeat protein